MLKKLINFIKNRYKLILAVLILAGIAVFFIVRSRPSQPEQVFETPQYRDIARTLEISGQVDAKRRARLRFLAGGKITYLGAQEGDWVRQWQTIASIDQRDLQKRLEKNLNLYMQQRWDWEDLQDNIKDEILDTSDRRYVDKQQWNLDNTVLDVEIQDIAISQASMSAPFAGILVYQPINSPHTQVTATDYFEIVDPQSLIFRAEINEEDIALASLNQPAKIVLDAYLNETLSTHINYISYVSAQTSGGNIFYVEFPLIVEEEFADTADNPTISKQKADKNLLNKYRLGLNGEVLIELESKSNVLTIPLIATKFRDNEVFVDIKNDNDETEERKIETGLESDEYVEVISGISESDLVLIPEI
jgi:membrane fusion protein, macrolide-specific efflux system